MSSKDNNDTSRRDSLYFILSLVRKHLPAILLGVSVLIVVDFVQLVIPKLVQKTIDFLGQVRFSQSLIARYTVYILLLSLSMVALRFIWRMLIIGSARKIEKELRLTMFEHLQNLDFDFYNRSKTGDLMALMINDVNAVRMATGPSFIALTDALFMGTLSLVFMFSINVKLTLFAIIPLPGIIFLMARFGPMIQNRFKAVQESFASISSQTQESFSGIRVVKGFVQELSERGVFEQKCDEYVEKNIRLVKIWGFFYPSVTLLANLSLTILYLFGGRAVITRSVSFGEFVSFAMYINLLVWPVIATGWVFNLLQRGMASAGRILDLLNTKPRIEDNRDEDFKIKEIHGDIRIENLTFSYEQDGREVLKNINLQIPAFSSLGIMGKHGAGKSTLIALLCRLFPITRGRILIDEKDIRRIPTDLLRRNIGYVPQDPFLFSDTIYNNIAFGLDDVSDEEVKRMADLTLMSEEIGEFTNGFDTVLGERGVTLSGGQKQRLSLARALIIKPAILILDDAFSSVDTSTEKEILSNVFAEIKGKSTIIIISHRVSTVMECDRIVIIDEGWIREQGTHQELIKKDGYYQRLYELQKLEEVFV